MVKKNLARVFLIPFFLLCTASTVHAAVVINEIVPKTDPVTNEWIELYNTGTDQVSLNAWSLQIINGNHKTFILNASNIIQSHGYLVFTEPQTGIDFDPSGDTLKLIDNNNTTIDTESYQGTLGFNTPLGRSPDGASNWLVCNSPAVPNQPNSCPSPTPSPSPTVTPIPTSTPISTDTPIPTSVPDAPTSPPQSAPEVLANETTTPVAPAGTTLTNTPTPTLLPDMLSIAVPKQIMISKTIAIEAAIIIFAWILLAVIAHLHRKQMRKTKRPPQPPPTSS